MATRQRDYLQADEALSAHVGAVATGLRDVVACGAQELTAARAHAVIASEARAARSLARWAAARALSLGVAGHVPVLLLLIAAPWLMRQRVTAGALLGALTYLTQSLMPALHTLMNALGAAGTRLLVVLDRLTEGPDAAGRRAGGPRPLRTAHGALQPNALRTRHRRHGPTRAAPGWNCAR